MTSAELHRVIWGINTGEKENKILPLTDAFQAPKQSTLATAGRKPGPPPSQGTGLAEAPTGAGREGFPAGVPAHGFCAHLPTALQQFQVKGDFIFFGQTAIPTSQVTYRWKNYWIRQGWTSSKTSQPLLTAHGGSAGIAQNTALELPVTCPRPWPPVPDPGHLSPTPA